KNCTTSLPAFPAVLAEKLHDLRKPLRTVRHAVLAQVFRKLCFCSVVKDSLQFLLGLPVPRQRLVLAGLLSPSFLFQRATNLVVFKHLAPLYSRLSKKLFPRQMAGILTNRAISEQGKSAGG